MKTRMSLVILLAIIAIGIVTITIQRKSATPEIKIGVILPLTGGNAQWGIAPLRGAEIAIKEINDHMRSSEKKLILKVEDGQCDNKATISAFNKLVYLENVKLIIGESCSSPTRAISPLAQKKKVLLISPAATSPLLTTAGEYFFRVIPSDAYRGRIFADFLFNEKKIKNIAILYINNDGGLGNKNAFYDTFTSLGGHLSTVESYEEKSTDYRSQLDKIASKKPDALLIISYLDDTALVLRQIKEFYPDIPIYLQTEAIEDPNVLKVAGNASEGVIYILASDTGSEVGKKFRESYNNKYGKEPELYSAEGYDSVYLLWQAIENTNSESPQKIKSYLHSVKGYEGASGLITFDENGDVIKPMAIKEIINGKPSVIKIIQYEK